MDYFKSKEGLLALFVSISCLIYFLVVPSEDAEVRRVKAQTKNKPVTLQNEKDVYSEDSTISTESASITNGYCLTLPILMYHHIEPFADARKSGHEALTVSPGVFESHILALKNKGYKIIPLREAVNALINKADPGKAAVITIDDGYKDNFTYALPIAQKNNTPITFFISPGLIENPGYMSWADLKNANTSGVVSIYNHTWSHFSLPSGNVAEAREEVKTGEKILNENLGQIEKLFAYPYGSFDTRSLEVLSSEGYVAAFTTHISSILCDSQMLSLPRVRIGEAPLEYFGL